jgi:hypothetical protein
MRRATLVLALGVIACSRPSGDAAPAASGSVAAVAPGASIAPPSTAPAASAPAGSGAPGMASSSWAGTYRSAASSLTVPPEWKKVHWSDTASTQGVGDGAMTLDVDGATGRVTGTLDGPLGPATLDGTAADGKVSATIVRKDPNDHGFGGTLLATVNGDKLEGTVSASLGMASALRTATFTLARRSGY